jgi:hypothetical protein
VNPGTLPEPPTDFANRKLEAVSFTQSLFRTHGINRNPIYYGKSGQYRFDAPDASYEVLYAGCDAFCAFVESLIQIPNRRVVTTTALKSRALSELKAVRPLRLIDLTVSGALVRIGADARLFSADREIAQLWSKVLHDHPIAADGLLYPSRLDPTRRAIALFRDRAPKIQEISRQSWYAPGLQRQLLVRIAEHYQIELIEDHVITPRKPATRQDGLFDKFPS